MRTHTTFGYPSELMTKSSKHEKVVRYEVPDHLHHSAIQILAQTLTQESEHPSYRTVESKGTSETILPNP